MKGLTHEQSAELRHEIVEYRKQGHYVRECCDKFNVAKSYVMMACRGIDYPWVKDTESMRQSATKWHEQNQTKPNEATAIRALMKTPTLEYVGGYTSTDGKFTVMSKICGHTFDVSIISVRHGKTKECPVCKKHKAEQEREERAREKKEQQYLKEQRELTKKLKFKSRQLEMKVCCQCGALFVPHNHNAKFCSTDCQKKQNNAITKDRRLKRMRELLIDRNITIEKLYEKFSGRCQICGMICDWNDYEVREGGTFIANGNYPSIDHIVPLAKGGKHEWANIQLACRRCNTIKSDRILPSVGF